MKTNNFSKKKKKVAQKSALIFIYRRLAFILIWLDSPHIPNH